MIHEALSKSEIALRYYKQTHPDRKYKKEAARKQFDQDLNLDVKLIAKIIDQIFREQKELLRDFK
jgi:hypothetical protein